MTSLLPLHSGEQASSKLYKQAVARFNAGDLPLACNLFRAAFDADSSNVQALIMLGYSHYKRDDYQTATGLLRDAIERAPFDPAAHYLLGMCRAANGEYRRSVLCYQRALSYHPAFWEAWFALSVAYERIGETLKARDAWQAFQDHAPSDKRRAAQQLFSLESSEK